MACKINYLNILQLFIYIAASSFTGLYEIFYAIIM